MAVETAARAAPPLRPGHDVTSVLIGFADALAAPEVAWSLAESGASVTAFARRGTRPALRRSRGIKIVEITPPEDNLALAISELYALLNETGHGALMPLDDTALWLCNAVSTESPALIIGPTGQTAELALDKRRQLSVAAEAGFAVPPTRCLHSVDELLAVDRLPVALKSALVVTENNLRLRRGVGYVCGTRAELEHVAHSWKGSEPLLAQPLISGVGEGLFGLAGPTGLAVLSAHRRVRMMNPQGSGSSACISTPVDPELANAAERFMLATGWTGMFMLEFLRDAEGTAWFMELNGRPWGSMALARRSGLEYPAWALRQSVDPDFAPIGTAVEGQVCRHLGREVVHLLAVLRGPRSVALTQWPSRRATVRQVLRVRRSDRWYNYRPGEIGVLLEDTVRTVARNLPRRSRG